MAVAACLLSLLTYDTTRSSHSFAAVNRYLSPNKSLLINFEEEGGISLVDWGQPSGGAEWLASSPFPILISFLSHHTMTDNDPSLLPTTISCPSSPRPKPVFTWGNVSKGFLKAMSSITTTIAPDVANDSTHNEATSQRSTTAITTTTSRGTSAGDGSSNGFATTTTISATKTLRSTKSKSTEAAPSSTSLQTHALSSPMKVEASNIKMSGAGDGGSAGQSFTHHQSPSRAVQYYYSNRFKLAQAVMSTTTTTTPVISSDVVEEGKEEKKQREDDGGADDDVRGSDQSFTSADDESSSTSGSGQDDDASFTTTMTNGSGQDDDASFTTTMTNDDAIGDGGGVKDEDTSSEAFGVDVPLQYHHHHHHPINTTTSLEPTLPLSSDSEALDSTTTTTTTTTTAKTAPCPAKEAVDSKPWHHHSSPIPYRQYLNQYPNQVKPHSSTAVSLLFCQWWI